MTRTTGAGDGPRERPSTTATVEKAADVLEAQEQRHVSLVEGEEVLAVRVAPHAIHVPIRPLCAALGITHQTQIERIRRDEVLAENLRLIKVQTAGGTQTMQCIELEGVPLWLAMIEPSRVREDLRERLRVYKRWVRQRVYEAFMQETGLDRAVVPSPSGDSALTLEQVEHLGLAIANLARQQRAYERQVDAQLAALEGHVGAEIGALKNDVALVHTRLDTAAEVFGGLVRTVKSLEDRLSPRNVVTEEQAAEVSNLVRAVATALTERDRATGTNTPPNWYRSIFTELYRRFSVSSYKLISVAQYPQVIAWLQEFQRASGGGPAPGQDETAGPA
jgi:hypothetical protein